MLIVVLLGAQVVCVRCLRIRVIGTNRFSLHVHVQRLKQYFAPQTNVAFEVFNFRKAKQKQDESLDYYHTR